MADRCAQCGGLPVGGERCESLFHACLAREYADPAYGEVHFLTVACFMIQHGHYSVQALRGIVATLREYFARSPNGPQVRRIAARHIPSDRDFRVLREVPEPLPITWPLTIADLAGYLDDAAGYRAAVERWGRATLERLEQAGDAGELDLGL